MTARPKPRVAVLGAGIMGCSTALFLARAGCRVTLVDRAPAAMTGASRWNEGKIHLGFLYAADPTLRTAGELIAGGIAFKGLTEELIGCSLDAATTEEDDLYLVHPDSVVDPAAMERYVLGVERLFADHDTGGYLAPIGKVERLDHETVAALSGGRVEAGFRVPERSVDTVWTADRFADAIAAEPNIDFAGDKVVTGLRPTAGSWTGPWRLLSEPVIGEAFDVVVNALWEGRLAVDRSLGLEPEAGWSHRFRLSLFIETGERLDLPSAVLATGPFGDVKNYGGHRFYLSWYPAGLVATGEDIEPPAIDHRPCPETVIRSAREGLTTYLPHVAAVFDGAKHVRVEGGWVFANGRGSLADPEASVHRRDRFGIRQAGTYFSVDTGKYSMAPWLARRLADRIVAR